VTPAIADGCSRQRTPDTRSNGGLVRLSDVVYRHMVSDATRAMTGPGGHPGAATKCSATGSHPHTGSSDKSLPGPATTEPTTALHAAC
jgi:hypothetical protein